MLKPRTARRSAGLAMMFSVLIPASSRAGVPQDGPVPPAAIVRDSEGRVTVRAFRVTHPMNVDGRLDEPEYETIEAISDFPQQEPDEGKPATEKTEAWIFFDDNNIYVSARCWETRPD